MGEKVIIFSGQLAKNLPTKSEVWNKNQLNNEERITFFCILYLGENHIYIQSYKKHCCVLSSVVFGSQFRNWKLK